MNEIEQMFYDAWDEELWNDDNELCTDHGIVSQVVIGIYRVDFVIDEEYVIEIDGFEYHKTKEQREKDYKRERYLMRHGFTVIRFTATEIYQLNSCFTIRFHLFPMRTEYQLY